MNVPGVPFGCGKVTTSFMTWVEMDCGLPLLSLYVKVYGAVPPEPVKVTFAVVGAF